MLCSSKLQLKTSASATSSLQHRASRCCQKEQTSVRIRKLGRQKRGFKVVASASSDGPPKPISVRMPWVRTGAAYTFILAGFLKILIFHIPGRDMVRTPLGEITPYLQVPFGLALCLIGKWAIDNDIMEKAPRLFYGIIAGVIGFMFMVANLSYDWRESDRMRARQYQPYQMSSIDVGATQQRADAERYAAKVREEETKRLLYLMEQDNLPVPDHLKPENPYPKLAPKTLRDLQAYDAYDMDDRYGAPDTSRRGGPRFPTQVGGE